MFNFKAILIYGWIINIYIFIKIYLTLYRNETKLYYYVAFSRKQKLKKKINKL